MYRKHIQYDRTTNDFAMYLDDELVGYARTYLEAEVELDNIVYERLRRAAQSTLAGNEMLAEAVEAGAAPTNAVDAQNEGAASEIMSVLRAGYQKGDSAARQDAPHTANAAVTTCFDCDAQIPADAEMCATCSAWHDANEARKTSGWAEIKRKERLLAEANRQRLLIEQLADWSRLSYMHMQCQTDAETILWHCYVIRLGRLVIKAQRRCRRRYAAICTCEPDSANLCFCHR